MFRRAPILHADLDAFFASVEVRDDPGLRGRPVVVGGGVVLAATYEARAFGVRAGMGGGTARRLCPGLVSVPPRFEAYLDASSAVFDVMDGIAPVVEKASIDEAFLDVSGLRPGFGTSREIAERLRRRVRDEVGLPISVGVASSKVVAKIASGEAKPDGLKVVEPGTELDFLHPLPVGRVSGVGPATTARLERYGLSTVGDIARQEEAALVGLFGRSTGRMLHAIAHNRESRRVRPRRRRRSFGSQRAMGLRRLPSDEIDATLASLAERVTGRMQKKGRAGRTVVLRLRFGDYERITRSRTLPRPTGDAAPVLDTLRALLVEAWPLVEARGVTMVGVTISALEPDQGDQLELFR